MTATSSVPPSADSGPPQQAALSPGLRTSTVPLRATVWCMHVGVTLLAVFSLVTNRFYLWVDLRALGPLALPFSIVWALSALLVRIFAGPRLVGWISRPRW